MRRCSQCGNRKPSGAFTSHKTSTCKRCEEKTKGKRRRDA